jgi:acyl-CoA synthetase (AMP-forming)/AMP-acid ligase II
VTLQLILEMSSSEYGDRPAYGLLAEPVSFADVQRQAAMAAAAVVAAGARHLVFVGRNGPTYAVLLFAAALSGVPFVPLNYRLSREQIAELFKDLPEPLVVAEPDYRPLLPDGDGVRVLTPQDMARGAESKEPALVDGNDIAVILFTSGTTSRPKPVGLSHENLASYIFSTVEFGVAGTEEAALVTVPPYHIAAIAATLSNFYAGRRVVHLPDFDPGEWLRLAREERISSAMVVPTMLARIVQRLDGESAGVPSLKLMSYGGARMPAPVLEAALELFPSTGFCNAYGLTETSSTICLLTPTDHRAAMTSDDPMVRARLRSVGRPVPGVETSIRDMDGQPVADGAQGELWVRGPQVSGGYRNGTATLDGDGWFHTKDQARVDGEGYIFIEGRADDTIIRGGENIAPAEIEDILLTHPAIKDVAVVGKADEEWGEIIVAVVVPEPGTKLLPEEVRTYARARLRGSRTPDQVMWRDALPHTSTGKLLRRQLAAEVAGSLFR